MAGTLIPSTVSTRQQWIAQLARENPGRALHSLSHHIDLGWLIEAHRRTRKDGATGIDGVTGAAYAVNLEANLRSLKGSMRNSVSETQPTSIQVEENSSTISFFQKILASQISGDTCRSL